MADSTYMARVGVIFRALINDLKRDLTSAARDLNVPVEVVEDIIGGRKAIPPQVVESAVKVWPVNERDFFPIHDDAPAGVRIMRAKESRDTTRVLRRGGRDYYEYRDTATSRISMFRPEWIRMIQAVEDNDPDNPRVEWNNGHFLYQFTYFVGAVNYYYEWNGLRRCVSMRTGDSVSGLPYAPHSFAARNGESALILALTYGGRLLGDAQHELSALGEKLSVHYACDNTSGRGAFSWLLGMHLDNASCPPEQLVVRSGMTAARVSELVSGSNGPTSNELCAIAAALRVNVRDLLPMVPDEVDGVHILRGEDAPQWLYPDDNTADYRIKELAGTLICPNSRALEIEVLGEGHTLLRTGLHTYLYNLGPNEIEFHWDNGERPVQERFAPDDSAYIKPFVPHRFSVIQPVLPGRLLVLRIGGKVCGDALLEASAIGPMSLRRLITDAGQWYKSEKPEPDQRGRT